MTMQPAIVGRARRGGSAGLTRAFPAPLPFGLASTAKPSRVAADPSLDGRPRGHTARESLEEVEIGKARGRSVRTHLFAGGPASLCGKSKQRAVFGVEVNCGLCARIARALALRWCKGGEHGR